MVIRLSQPWFLALVVAIFYSISLKPETSAVLVVIVIGAAALWRTHLKHKRNKVAICRFVVYTFLVQLWS